MKTYILGLLSLSLTVAAGDFVNLTFDQPNLNGPLTPLVPGGPYSGHTSDLLPGWTITANGTPLNSIVYSPPQTSSARPVTLRENSGSDLASPLGPFSLYLDSGQGPLGPELRLSQTGTIPVNAIELRLASSYIQVFADGTKIGEINPRTGPFTINVSPYAGKEVNLEFLVRAGDTAFFDILGFTTTAIPEPSTWALLGVGLAALSWHLRHCR